MCKIGEDFDIDSCGRERTQHRKSSATGTRTRVARVRAEYPNQLDYSGSSGACVGALIKQLQKICQRTRLDAAAQENAKGLLWELNPGPLAPEARIIPLDQAAGACMHTLFFPLLHYTVNHIKHKCRDPGSNRGPSDLQSDALPTELSRLALSMDSVTLKGVSAAKQPQRFPYMRTQAAGLHQDKIHAQGTWCSGITSASHAEGPGFKSQCVHIHVHCSAQ